MRTFININTYKRFPLAHSHTPQPHRISYRHGFRTARQSDCGTDCNIKTPDCRRPEQMRLLFYRPKHNQITASATRLTDVLAVNSILMIDFETTFSFSLSQ